MAANYKKVIDLVNKIIEDNFIIDPPIPIEKLIQYYGLKVFYRNFNDQSEAIAGFIDLESNYIVVNEEDSPSRQAFTLAHELGHWLLHKELLTSNPELGVLYRKPLGELNKDDKEKEANCFAANLLVPKNLLDKYKDLDVSTISKIFGVSSDVIGFRFKIEYE